MTLSEQAYRAQSFVVSTELLCLAHQGALLRYSRSKYRGPCLDLDREETSIYWGYGAHAESGMFLRYVASISWKMSELHSSVHMRGIRSR